ncbi:hypothetical protein Cmtc_30060 [Cupriavidus sp. TKC]|nr:hypothetical protein Cmtc_30060 [Cupriavidus sp. TKC]
METWDGFMMGLSDGPATRTVTGPGDDMVCFFGASQVAAPGPVPLSAPPDMTVGGRAGTTG